MDTKNQPGLNSPLDFIIPPETFITSSSLYGATDFFQQFEIFVAYLKIEEKFWFYGLEKFFKGEALLFYKYYKTVHQDFSYNNFKSAFLKRFTDKDIQATSELHSIQP